MAPLSGKHVVVAGAGLAGLVAARELEKRGARLTVIEARERVGGRVWTLRDGFADGQHAEAGADLIESDQQGVIDLAHELGLTVARILRRGFGYYGTNRRGRLAMQSLTNGFDEIAEPLERVKYDFCSSDQRWDTAIAHRFSSMSVAAWLREIHAPKWLLSRFRGFRGLFLAEPEELSLLALIDFLADDPFSSMGSTVRVREGNDAIATTIAKQLKSRPRLHNVLRRVQSRTNGIVASVESSGRRARIKADYLVAALPATTLREVTFEPKLQPRQQEAFEQLRYGCATRVLLQCAPRFWRRIGRYDLLGSDQPFGAVWSGNDQQRGRTGILSLLAGGAAAGQLRTTMRTGGPETLLQQLRWLGKPDVVHAWKMVSWDEDPWSRGGYAYFHAGFDPELRAWLSRPHKRIVFAGEHTSIRWQGYMNGAVESGKRAAAEIEAMAMSRR